MDFLLVYLVLYLLIFHDGQIHGLNTLPSDLENHEDKHQLFMQRLQRLLLSNDSIFPNVTQITRHHTNELKPVASLTKFPSHVSDLREDSKEVLITAQSDKITHPIHGSQMGMLFIIPEGIADQEMEEAEIHFNEFKISYDNFSLARHTKLFLELFSPDNSNHNQRMRFRLRPTKRHTRRSPLEICCQPLNLVVEMDNLLMASVHLSPSFKMRFFVVKETVKWLEGVQRSEVEFISLTDMPVLLLKYRPKIRNIRNTQYSNDCGTTPQLENCCLVKSQATLVELGWNGTVEAPNIVPLNYCRGSCNSKSQQKNANAMLRMTILERRIGREVGWRNFKFCCVPTSYSTLKVSKRINGNVRVEYLHDAIVNTCGCV